MPEQPEALLSLAKIRAKKEANARSKWIAQSAAALDDIKEQAKANGINLGTALAGPVCFENTNLQPKKRS